MKKSITVLTLKRTGYSNGWAIFAPKGHQISNMYHSSNMEDILRWAKAWTSSWKSIELKVEYDKKD